ncbi:hypothetical protein PV392_19740 [Streptomyces sp. ME03-5709C]|nr:hypothetical protein [Streptomyces sp. ME03-5709C]
MSHWLRTFGGRGAGASVPAPGQSGGRMGGAPAPEVLVEDHDGLLVLRPATDDSLDPADVSDLSRTMASSDGVTTIVVAVEPDARSGLWPRLREVLDTLQADGVPCLRLLLSGAGDDRPGRPAVARRIADAWNTTVDAPDGPVVVVPGGSAFVPPGTGGWWRFAPGRAPEPLGPRMPSPRWQAALRRVSATAVGGCVVDQVPAGLLIRPEGSAPPRPGDLFHTVPADPRRAAVIVGVPFGEDVAASDVVTLMEALPAEERGVRLIPGGRSDLLPLARSVASASGVEIEVTTGLPLFASDGPMGRYGLRSTVVGHDQVPRWLPFVDAVVCAPAGTQGRPGAPRLLRWFAPAGIGGPRDTNGPVAKGEFVLSPEWRAVVTRAGLWVGPTGDTGIPHSDRPVNHDGPVIDVGRPGDRLTATLWPVLSRLLASMAPGVRALTTLHVHATPPDGGRVLRALAAEHRLRVIRFSTSQGARPLAPGALRTQVGAAATGGSRPEGTVPDRPSDDRLPEGAAAPGAGGPSPAPIGDPSAPGSDPVPPPPRATGTAGPPQEAGRAAKGTTPMSPRHWSTPEQRGAFRGLAGEEWERHSAAVRRAMAGLPAARDQRQEAVHDDLVAVRMYLEQTDDTARHAELQASFRSGEREVLPFAACLTSGLQWLAPYRGAVLRGAAPAGAVGDVRPGQTLHEAAPVSGLRIDRTDTAAVARAAYAIWSITGRAAGSLREGTDEIVFAPGTRYRVLDVHTEAGTPLVLLRQLPDRVAAETAGALEDADEIARTRLELALVDLTWGTGPWPARCTGTIGTH